MKLQIEGKINVYYVQMLCMIFFPGISFKQEDEDKEGEPSLYVRMDEREDGYMARATMFYKNKSASAEQFCSFTQSETKARCAKLAVGAAVMSAGEKLLGYRPSWGIMTGVRPAKLAMELLEAGKTPEQIILSDGEDFFIGASA